MQIRCAQCSGTVAVADTGVLPATCPHCRSRPVPERLGRFKVQKLLAAGGMGEVYLGEHEQLGTRVALKVLPLAAGTDGAALRERFRREARLTAAIDDPGVVQVLDVGEEQGRPFFVLELVAGRSLRARLRDGPVSLPEALRIAAEVARVLGAAHARGVVHRDVKPENVMLCPDGRVRVLDFGIARAVQDQEPLTRTGEILGTPEYMAPEQLLEAADAVDARADVHALGVLSYELLTARSPFAGPSLFAVLKLVESLEPPPPSRLAAVPPAVDAVVLRALRKEPAARFPDGAAFAAALREAAAATADGVPRRGRRWVVAVLLASAAALAITVALQLRAVDQALQQAAAGVPVRSELAVAGAARELSNLLTPAVVAPGDRAIARRWLAVLDGVAEGGGEQAAGIAAAVQLRLGAFHAALHQGQRAGARGDRAAASVAAVAWHCAHTALPQALGLPPWLLVVDRSRRDRVLALRATEAGVDAANGADADALLRACPQLALGDPAAAWQTLQAVPEAAWTQEHAAIALLAARAACADPATFAAVADRLVARFDAPAVRVCAVTADGAADLFAALAADQDTDGPDRWSFEFAAAAARTLAERHATPRLRSAAELAWLQGAGPALPFWSATVRTLLAARGVPLDPSEAARLQTLFAERRPDEAPAGEVARALIDLADEPGNAGELLRRAALPAEPAFAALAALAQEPRAAAPIAQLLARGSVAPAELPPATTAALALAHACAALGDSADDAAAHGRRRAHWCAALATPADLEALAWYAAAAPGPLADLGAELEAAAARTPGSLPPGFLPALRLCARAGADLGALRATFLAELTHGIR